MASFASGATRYPGRAASLCPEGDETCADDRLAPELVNEQGDELGVELRCEPAYRLSSSSAHSRDQAAWYGLWWVIASNASAIRTMRASSGIRSPRTPSA